MPSDRSSYSYDPLSTHRHESVSEFLTEQDIRKLTGRVKRALQEAELLRQRIPYRINARGELVVRRGLSEKPLPDFELGPVR